MDMNAFADRIRKLRGNKSQREVAGCIGTTQQSLGRYESGKRKPDLEIVEQLSRYFGVSADYLLGIDDDPTPNYDMEKAGSITGLSQPALEHLLQMRMDESLEGIDDLLEYIVMNLTPELIGTIQRAHNLTMDRYRDRLEILKQYNEEQGTALPEDLLSYDPEDFTKADARGMREQLQLFNEYYKQIILDRCQDQLKKPDKITVETAMAFEQQCREYAAYQMYYADYMQEQATKEIAGFADKVRLSLLNGNAYFGGPVDHIIEMFQDNEE